MNKSNLKNTIVLIGPKAVGKTFISTKLSEQTGMSVISSDLLTSLLVLDSSSLTASDFPNELKQDNERYRKIFNFKELSHFVIEIAKIYQNENLSEKAKKLTMQYWKTRLLEEAISQLDKPVILDLGADIGAVYDLNQQEKKDAEYQMFFSESVISSRQSNFLKQFENVFYLKPSKDYFLSKNERILNEDNQTYLENPNSYSSFATQEISTDKLFSKEKYKLTEIELEKLQKNERAKLVNSNEIDNITSKILTTMNFSENGPTIL